MARENILIVEGEEGLAKELQGTLQENGYKVKEAKNEVSALQILGNWDADFVLLAEKDAILHWTNRLKRKQEEKITDESGSFVIDTVKRLVEKDGEEIAFTPTEYKLLVTMAKSPNRIFTREQLITYALDDEFGGYDRSIDTYIKELRRKLKEDARNPRYIHTVHGVGYKFVL